ncbi:MAG: Ni/Fe hydrogenase subunit alpha [Dehalococcoidia bacterium]
MSSNRTRTVRVNYLARVEGEGGLYLKVRNNQVQDVQLRIFEPPRFFEAFLRGRRFDEAPDITARICGICPVAYQMSAVHAMEDAFGIKVEGPLRDLRRLIYCGEWIESHALHVFMLHAPDFLGYEDAVQMAKDHSEIVQRGLQLKKTGNEILKLIGGREIHPINVRVGGFYRVPTRKELETLVDDLEKAREIALDTVRWTAELPFPDFEPDYTFVALHHPEEYPFNEGRILSSGGLDIAAPEFTDHFTEEHVSYSNALHCTLRGVGEYLTGPLARYNLNFPLLGDTAREAAQEAGLSSTCGNPFRSIVVRSVELVQACDEALRIIGEYQMPDQPTVPVLAQAGIGHGCTEAPRGILYHRYQLDDAGNILDAKIVPPTSQNQKRVESDLREFVPNRLHLTRQELTWQCEQLIRNYDPCISCSTHFLDLTLDRE